jgi:hypothetical protein
MGFLQRYLESNRRRQQPPAKVSASSLSLDISLHPYCGITSAVKVFSFSMALRHFWYTIFTKNSQKLSFPISLLFF